MNEANLLLNGGSIDIETGSDFIYEDQLIHRRRNKEEEGFLLAATRPSVN